MLSLERVDIERVITEREGTQGSKTETGGVMLTKAMGAKPLTPNL